MKCIIIDDEPLAREAVRLLVEATSGLKLLSSFADAASAEKILSGNEVDLVFLDIRMPGIDGIEFAKTIQHNTLVIFTTAYSEYAIDSYEVDAIDYLVKPIELERFQKAVEKARDYLALLSSGTQKSSVEAVTPEQLFVKSDRRYYKILFKDILFIEGLKDYVVIQTPEQKIITHMNLATIGKQLPKTDFLRVSKSYIVNTLHIDSFDNNDVFIKTFEIPIGSTYRDIFFEEFVTKNVIKDS
ncbi:MAG: LytTR family DNA-binding domain-containing protein [Tannerella sp.]|jgi:DNA-binding LytR/AlgR family response regulator|nr:LytTR family DNA-binding domain-containing protein [Tannerella sp.]